MSCSVKAMMGGRKRRVNKKGGDDNQDERILGNETYDELEMDSIPTATMEEQEMVVDEEPEDLSTIIGTNVEEENENIVGGARRKRRRTRRRGSRKSKKAGKRKTRKYNKKYSRSRKH